jgi:hexokinase
MHPDLYDFNSCKSAFIADMTAGLSGKPSSMKMIPTYLSADGRLPDEGTAVAVDIGGTNLRIALTACSGGALRIVRLDEYPVPGLTREITKAEFFEELTGRLQPFVHESDNIGVCFSHAAEILPNRDGKLISFSKEIRVTGSEGMEITRELSAALKQPAKNYVLLNDTAAVLLGGTASEAGAGCDGAIGFVLGTGMNLCYEEKTPEIKKLGGLYDRETMLINTESGYFMDVPAGEADLSLDKSTANPGINRLEKMMSGRYLGQLVLLTLQKLAADRLLAPRTCSAVLALKELGLPEVSAFLADLTAPGVLRSACANDEDREAARIVADRLVERVAKLAAVQIAAVLEKTGAGTRRENPVCIAAEGSTFHKLHSFRSKFESYLRDLTLQGQRRYMRIISVDSATILGTAFAAMTN